MVISRDVYINPFQAEYQDEIKQLILSGLKDHWREIDPPKIIELTKTWSELIAFYENNGVQISYRQDGDVYFALNLTFLGALK